MFDLRIVRRAFTLVEMLVVIAIIGVLIGLMLPAVQSARESGRRIKCVNNLKQLGLAMQHYEGVYNAFPINSGDGTTSGLASKGGSWLARLLPFMEQKQIYDLIKLGEALNYAQTGFDNLQAAQQVVPEFICPSDVGDAVSGAQQPALGTLFGVTDYKACTGMNWLKSVNPKPPDGAKTDRSDVPIYSLKGRNSGNTPTGTDGLDHGNGVICRNALTATNTTIFVTRTRDIKDGLSRTFAIGESVPEWCAFSAWFYYDGSIATCGIPLNYEDLGLRRKDYRDDPCYSRGFMSRHPGGANFGMCDGSVHFVSSDIEYLRLTLYSDPDYLIIPPPRVANAPPNDAGNNNYSPGVYMRMATIDGGELVAPPE